MKFKNIYICKPGCNLEPKENKTNLQIREMEAMQNAFYDIGVKAELVTIPWLASNALSLTNCAIICFNSAKCFNDELELLVKMCSVIEDIDLTLISNDCRLNFKLDNSKFTKQLMDNFMQSCINIRILTNASINLSDYLHEIIDWPNSSVIPIYFSALFTLPSFLPGAITIDKTVASVFTCMHFKDYSIERQHDLTELKTILGDSLVLSGDMSTMIVNDKEVASIITDTNEVWQWYKNAKTTPVLLEPKYEQYGVLPNRVSEAISCRCIPMLFTKNYANYNNSIDIDLPLVQTTIQNLADVIMQYDMQYYSHAIQSLLDSMQLVLGLYKQQFTAQLNIHYK